MNITYDVVQENADCVTQVVTSRFDGEKKKTFNSHNENEVNVKNKELLMLVSAKNSIQCNKLTFDDFFSLIHRLDSIRM